MTRQGLFPRCWAGAFRGTRQGTVAQTYYNSKGYRNTFLQRKKP